MAAREWEVETSKKAATLSQNSMIYDNSPSKWLNK